jgi:hypothetical protein
VDLGKDAKAPIADARNCVARRFRCYARFAATRRVPLRARTGDRGSRDTFEANRIGKRDDGVELYMRFFDWIEEFADYIDADENDDAAADDVRQGGASR